VHRYVPKVQGVLSACDMVGAARPEAARARVVTIDFMMTV